MTDVSKPSDREELIFQFYFVEELNLDEIGQTLGVGAARVCQTKKAAFHKMKSIMADKAAYGNLRRIGTGILQISVPPAGTLKNASRRFARASA